MWPAASVAADVRAHAGGAHTRGRGDRDRLLRGRPRAAGAGPAVVAISPIVPLNAPGALSVSLGSLPGQTTSAAPPGSDHS